MANSGKTNNAIIAILAVAVIAILAFVFMGAQDNRSGGERIGDAIGELQEGRPASEAVEQLEDRSAADKAADSVGDAVEDVKQEVQ